ncbi:probable G-protein coupled receptor Mth-like 3 [Anoplolepis gracilipes]|uniref:probable G-protein coupled receptor Mth-like 3 n=1 Tax=Anoplolepis gracilipes TaxID=354296 RepID=UPI003B9E1565
MCDKSFVLWCCVLLVFFVSSTKPLRNFIIDNKDDNSMLRNELHSNFTEYDNKTIFNRYNLRKNFTMDYKHAQDVFRINSRSRKDNDSIHNEFPVHYVKYHDKRNQMRRELRANFTNVDNKNYSNNKNDNKNYIVPYEANDNYTYVRLCCPLGARYQLSRNCITEGPEYVFADVYKLWSETNIRVEYKKLDEMFQLIVQDPCPKDAEIVRVSFNNESVFYKYFFLENGTLYLPYFDQFVESTSYCLAIINDVVDAVICLKTLTEAVRKHDNTYYIIDQSEEVVLEILDWIYIIISLLCMLALFLIYCIPKLNNIHSFMLRRYSSMIFIYHMSNLLKKLIDMQLPYSMCIASALVNYFSSLAAFFWLSVMSFDMWWTFRNVHSLQKNMKQQGKKKFLYSIIGWGGPVIFCIICIIMEIVPSVPESLQPKLIVNMCLFHFSTSKLFYIYGPITTCASISIFLSIYTALKIMQYEKDTARHLKDTESRCYNENKKWFNLYINLFIIVFLILATKRIVSTTIFWLFKDYAGMIYIILNILDVIQNVGIFIIFVCKKTIMQLLFKHFYQNCRYFSNFFTRSSSYNLEHVNHHVKQNNLIDKYQIQQKF